MSAVGVLSVTIPANQSQSDGVDLGTNELIALEIPASVTVNTISFLAASKQTHELGDEASQEDLENWRPVFDSSGNEVSMTVAANRVVVPTAAVAAALAPLRYIRLRAGTSVAPVNINPLSLIKIITKLA